MVKIAFQPMLSIEDFEHRCVQSWINDNISSDLNV